jgi:hypothetical protein
MPINQNHLFEDLDGTKCAIAEKNATRQRVDFLRSLLESNGYTVVVVPSPPAKPAAQAPAASAQNSGTESAAPPPPPPETFTIGVTDLMFNPINAIFGRLLRAPGGHVVTLAYWQQKESVSSDEVPYFEEGKNATSQEDASSKS